MWLTAMFGCLDAPMWRGYEELSGEAEPMLTIVDGVARVPVTVRLDDYDGARHGPPQPLTVEVTSTLGGVEDDATVTVQLGPGDDDAWRSWDVVGGKGQEGDSGELDVPMDCTAQQCEMIWQITVSSPEVAEVELHAWATAFVFVDKGTEPELSVTFGP